MCLSIPCFSFSHCVDFVLICTRRVLRADNELFTVLHKFSVDFSCVHVVWCGFRLCLSIPCSSGTFTLCLFSLSHCVDRVSILTRRVLSVRKEYPNFPERKYPGFVLCSCNSILFLKICSISCNSCIRFVLTFCGLYITPSMFYHL